MRRFKGERAAEPVPMHAGGGSGRIPSDVRGKSASEKAGDDKMGARYGGASGMRCKGHRERPLKGRARAGGWLQNRGKGARRP